MNARVVDKFYQRATCSICILTPTRFEFNTAVRILDSAVVSNEKGLRTGRGKYGEANVVIFQIGIKAARLPVILEVLHASRPRIDLALVCGLAAGLTPSLRVGDLVLYDRCNSIRNQALEIHAPSDWLRAIHQLLYPLGSSFVSCSGITVGQLLSTTAEKILLGRQFNVQAADMESFDILEAMRRNLVPALVLRSISDAADQPLPDIHRAIDVEGRLMLKRAIPVLLGEPLRVARLAHGASRARQSLRRALRCLLSDLPIGLAR